MTDNYQDVHTHEQRSYQRLRSMSTSTPQFHRAVQISSSDEYSQLYISDARHPSLHAAAVPLLQADLCSSPHADISLVSPSSPVGSQQQLLWPLVPTADNCARAAPSTAYTRRPYLFNRNKPRLAIQTRSKPRVKVCVLCTGGPGVPVLLDTSLILKGLAGIPNIDPEHIATRTSKLIDVAFDNFFDPTDILSCHGFQSGGNNVVLQFHTQDGAIIDSRMLQDKIMALPNHCTLEVVVDTCCAEGVIPGLHRISAMNPSTSCTMPIRVPDYFLAHNPTPALRSNTKAPMSPTVLNGSFLTTESLELTCSFLGKGPSIYKAQVVVWAASTESGNSFTEENLPEKPGVYSILIGAIFNQLGSSGPNMKRRNIWENVLKVVEEHNHTRRQRDLCKPLKIQTNLIRANRIQNPILLTSIDNPDRVLSGHVFQRI
ncbi:hypothetical protein B0J17DRAFT_679899 [Rhizoctonia solani]|nr:hypothetical protein B0J17DRAFT_679899 [Rhizoctonia solani]